MSAEAEPREELLSLVRSLSERVRVDAAGGRPLSYLFRKEGGGEADAGRGLAPAIVAPAGAGRSGLEAVVFGEGSAQAELVFVGEAPGADEDAQGRPFVGRAGQLLTKIVGAMGLQREEVYICNILKCRPPGNRNPQPDEIAACEPFLIRQLQMIRPKVICALGTFAAHTLLKSEAPISVLRGCFHTYQGIPLMPTYHPAYLLRNPGAKKQVWEDVQMVMKVLRGDVG
jgi:uracil-DNA glycosylase family 4